MSFFSDILIRADAPTGIRERSLVLSSAAARRSVAVYHPYYILYTPPSRAIPQPLPRNAPKLLGPRRLRTVFAPCTTRPLHINTGEGLRIAVECAPSSTPPKVPGLCRVVLDATTSFKNARSVWLAYTAVNRLAAPKSSPVSPQGKVVLLRPRPGPETKILSNACLWAWAANEKRWMEADGDARGGGVLFACSHKIATK